MLGRMKAAILEQLQWRPRDWLSLLAGLMTMALLWFFFIDESVSKNVKGYVFAGGLALLLVPFFLIFLLEIRDAIDRSPLVRWLAAISLLVSAVWILMRFAHP